MNLESMLRKRMDEITDSDTLTKSFTSSSLSELKRVFILFNANVKTINTYAKYLSDLTYSPKKDNHQKKQILKKMRVFYTDDDLVEKNKVSIRRDILLKAHELFPEPSSFYKSLIVFILALNTNYNIKESSQYILDTLPESLLCEYDSWLRKLLTKGSASICNPVYGIFVMYSDYNLLDIYLDLFSENFVEFEKVMESIEKYSIIKKRIKTCQKSSFKAESILFSLYSLICKIDQHGKDYEQTINCLLVSVKKMLNELDYKHFNKQFTIEVHDFQKIREFFLNLNENEKEEILECLRNTITYGSAFNYKRDDSLLINTGLSDNGEGSEVECISTSRRGQKKFKRALFKRNIHDGIQKCAISDCNITGEQFLVASHIVPWKYANSKEKVDPNNGLLLCPNHDFLFDNLYISFNEQGKIMFSKKFIEENWQEFRVSPNTYVDMTPEIEVYMFRHRNAMKKGKWEK